MKLALGTAQFGMDYGVSNPNGQVPAEEVDRILSVARGSGIRVLDTAPNYGDSEEVIGGCIARHHWRDIQIVTKARKGSEVAGQALPAAVAEGIHASLTRLGVEQVHGILVHDVSDLLGDGGAALYETLSRMREQGLVSRIGASVYDAQELETLSSTYRLDLFQVPGSVLDQRLLTSPILQTARDNGAEIHVRSAFLQGLLLMEPESIPARLEYVRHLVVRFQRRSEALGLSPGAAALGFLKAQAVIDRIIVGVTSVGELERNIDAYNQADVLPDAFDDVACQDETVLDPRKWPQP